MRGARTPHLRPQPTQFPFLFGGTFIEGIILAVIGLIVGGFPFLFGGTFIEGAFIARFPGADTEISLPFRRDFH